MMLWSLCKKGLPMNRKLSLWVGCFFLLQLFPLTAARVTAQDPDEDSFDDKPVRWAQLGLTLNNRGDANINLNFDKKPESWDAIRIALGRALHCSTTGFTNGEPLAANPYLSSLNEKQRTAFQRSMANAAERQLKGDCAAFVTGDQWIKRGALEIAPLAEALRESGIERLQVSISY